MASKQRQEVSSLLRQTILQLCKASLPLDEGLEIDGIVCITFGKEAHEIVVKVHEHFMEDEPSSPSEHQMLPGNMHFGQFGVGAQGDGLFQTGRQKRPAQGSAGEHIRPQKVAKSGEFDSVNPEMKAMVVMSSAGENASQAIPIDVSLIRMEDDQDLSQKSHSQPQQFHCLECDLMLSSFEEFNIHNVSIHKITSTCNFCLKTFKQKRTFIKHLKTEHGVVKPPNRGMPATPPHSAKKGRKKTRPIICGICEHTEMALEAMIKHMCEKHEFQQHFMCQICHQLFPSRHTFVAHRKLKHPSVKKGSKRVLCPNCDIYLNPAEFKKHVLECQANGSAEMFQEGHSMLHEHAIDQENFEEYGEEYDEFYDEEDEYFDEDSEGEYMDEEFYGNEYDPDLEIKEEPEDGGVKTSQASQNQVNPQPSGAQNTGPFQPSSNMKDVSMTGNSQMQDSVAIKEDKGDKVEGVSVSTSVPINTSQSQVNPSYTGVETGSPAHSSAQTFIGSHHSQKQGHVGKAISDSQDNPCPEAKQGTSAEGIDETVKYPEPCKGPFVCKAGCTVTFQDFDEYKQHCIDSHKKFPCKYCEKVLSNKTTLLNHQLTHGPRTQKCQFCEKAFHTWEALRKHYRSAHPEVDLSQYSEKKGKVPKGKQKKTDEAQPSGKQGSGFESVFHQFLASTDQPASGNDMLNNSGETEPESWAEGQPSQQPLPPSRASAPDQQNSQHMGEGNSNAIEEDSDDDAMIVGEEYPDDDSDPDFDEEEASWEFAPADSTQILEDCLRFQCQYCDLKIESKTHMIIHLMDQHNFTRDRLSDQEIMLHVTQESLAASVWDPRQGDEDDLDEDEEDLEEEEEEEEGEEGDHGQGGIPVSEGY